jgi:hypothetical protein
MLQLTLQLRLQPMLQLMLQLKHKHLVLRPLQVVQQRVFQLMVLALKLKPQVLNLVQQ